MDLQSFVYRFNEIERFDIVVIKKKAPELETSNGSEKEIIKRIIGLPGEEIIYRSNTLYVDGHELKNDYNFDTDDFSLKTICNCTRIPEDKYLVLGDNRAVSADSRIMGLIDKDEIQGSVKLSLWPVKTVK